MRSWCVRSGFETCPDKFALMGFLMSLFNRLCHTFDVLQVQDFTSQSKSPILSVKVAGETLVYWCAMIFVESFVPSLGIFSYWIVGLEVMYRSPKKIDI